MVQHIVLWNFNDDVEKDKKLASIKQGFSAFSGSVPGMSSLELYRGFQGYDVCLISFHKDAAALESYQQHPAHLEMKKVIAACRKDRASCDFEV